LTHCFVVLVILPLGGAYDLEALLLDHVAVAGVPRYEYQLFEFVGNVIGNRDFDTPFEFLALVYIAATTNKFRIRLSVGITRSHLSVPLELSGLILSCYRCRSIDLRFRRLC